MDIQQFFKVDMLRLSTDDWDHVEDTIKRIIKSSRADPDFHPHGAGLLRDGY